MRLSISIMLILGLTFLQGFAQNKAEGTPYRRHVGPLVYIDQPLPLGGYQAIQDLIIYPDTALALNLEGTVIIQCTIDTDGFARQATAILGPELLFNAAIDAVELSQWKPAQLDGEPLAIKVEFALDFILPQNVSRIPQDPVAQTLTIKNIFAHMMIAGILTGLIVFLRA